MTLDPTRLQLHYANFPDAIDPNHHQAWIFDQQLKQQHQNFFLPLLYKQQLIRLEFDVLQTQIETLINQESDISTHENKLVTALMLAETLQYQYCHFFADKNETIYFQQQAKTIRALLGLIGYTFPNNHLTNPALLSDPTIYNAINQTTRQYNVVRQGVQRTRRFIIELNRIIKNIGYNSAICIEEIDHLASPLINYLVLLFYIPRTVSNLWILGKHVLPGKNEEQKLRWTDRLILQMKQRGFQLSDDMVWLVVNVSVCFIFIGPLSHWAVSMMLFQQTSEVILRITKLLTNMPQLMRLRHHYLSLLEQDDISNDVKEQVENYLTHLDKRVNYEIKKLLLDVTNSSTVLLLTLMTVTMLSLCPIIPAITSGLLVGATILFHVLNKQMLNNRPHNPQALVSKLGLFTESGHDKPDLQPECTSKTQPFNESCKAECLTVRNNFAE